MFEIFLSTKERFAVPLDILPSYMPDWAEENSQIKFTVYAVMPKCWASMSKLCGSLLSSREEEVQSQKRARHLGRAIRATAPAKVRRFGLNLPYLLLRLYLTLCRIVYFPITRSYLR